MLHLFRFDSSAIRVPPQGNRLGERYRRGDWQCVMCLVSLGMAVRFGSDHAGDCPGLVSSVPPDLEL